MKPPVFVVGHWRSGTTHICNVLSQSPHFGFVTPIATGLPHDLLLMGKLFRPWLEKSIPDDRLIDRVAVDINSPQEDEFGMANIIENSFLHGLYFPRYFERNFSKGIFLEECTEKEINRWINASVQYLKKIYLDQNERQLLIRNPAYTTRIPLLRKIWPGARFIHIYRDPYRVFPSMKNYFNKLLPAYSLQPYHHLDVDEVIFSTYLKMMKRLIDDLSRVPDEEYIEISYESMEKEPIHQLSSIYTRLGLTGFEFSRPYFEKYLHSIQGYSKNKYVQSEMQRKLINDRWIEIIEHYRY